MTDKEKKVIFALIAIMVIILIIVIVVKNIGGGEETNTLDQSATNQNVEDDEKYTIELNDGTKLNNSKELKNAKKYKTVEIGNIQITSKNGNTTILADVKNTGTTEFPLEDIKIKLIGENEEIIATVPATIPRTKVGETTQINTVATADIANVKDFTIEAK